MIAEYYYDPFGRRLWKDVGGVRTYFHYTDEGLVGEYDGTGTEIKTYGYKPGSTWTTDPLFIKENNQYYFYHNDHLGTPQKITAMNGAVVWSAKYSAFGEATVNASSTITNNLRFPGQYFDQETGLHYNWFRYYDAAVGRYLRPDPIKFAHIVIVGRALYDRLSELAAFYSHSYGIDTDFIRVFAYQFGLKDHQLFNNYLYAYDNPFRFKDPTGELASIIGGAIGGFIVGGIAGGIVSGVASFISGDSWGEIVNSTLVGMGAGAVVGAVAGGLAGAGIVGPAWGIASSDFWAGVTVGMGPGEAAAVSSTWGAIAGAITSIFTNPEEACG